MSVQFHNRKLLEAVKSGLEVQARSALAAGADPNIVDVDGTPLTQVCAGAGRIELMKMFIKSGADFSRKDKNGNTLLKRCVIEGWSKALQAALDAGGDPNETDDVGDTLVHHAAAKGRKGRAQLECLAVLLRGDASARFRNGRGETVAHHAARYGGPSAINQLKDFTDFAGSRDLDGAHPIHAAAQAADNDDGLRALLALGVNPNQRDKDGRTAMHLIALKSKTKACDLQMAKALLAAGGNLWAKDRDGYTAHDYALLGMSQYRELLPDLILAMKPTGRPVADDPKDFEFAQSDKKKGGKK